MHELTELIYCSASIENGAAKKFFLDKNITYWLSGAEKKLIDMGYDRFAVQEILGLSEPKEAVVGKEGDWHWHLKDNPVMIHGSSKSWRWDGKEMTEVPTERKGLAESIREAAVIRGSYEDMAKTAIAWMNEQMVSLMEQEYRPISAGDLYKELKHKLSEEGK